MNQVNMINIKERLQEAVNDHSYIDSFIKRDSSNYICDIVSEIADSNVSIYASDIYNYIRDNLSEVEETITEYGWEGCGKSLQGAGQLTQFHACEQELYQNLDLLGLSWCLNYLIENKGIEEVTEAQMIEIESLCTDNNGSKQLTFFEEELESLFDSEEEEQENEE